jgi:hypothetical protein
LSYRWSRFNNGHLKPIDSAPLWAGRIVRFIIVLIFFILVARFFVNYSWAFAQTNSGITSPVAGATVYGNVVINGTATSEPFAKYELAFKREPSGDNAYSYFAGASKQVIAGKLGVWRTAGLEPGVYSLRLRVVRPDGNYTEYFVQNVTVSAQPPTQTVKAANQSQAAKAPPAPTLTPFIVTATPTAEDIFIAATAAAQITLDAAATGTTTPTPRNMVLATRTPTPMVVTSTPTAENSATAELMALRETAIAATTGTPAMVTATPTLTPFIVTATPTPEDVFLAATALAQMTLDAANTGTATPTPRNMILATRTPAPIVVTSTPTAENDATATVMTLRETAVAFTTGTPALVTATPKPPKK